MIQHSQKYRLKNEVKMKQTGLETKFVVLTPGLDSFILTILLAMRVEKAISKTTKEKTLRGSHYQWWL